MENKGKAVAEVFELQTDSLPLELQKKTFCLYCFSRTQRSFCGGSCEQLYNAMFQRYENNLEHAQSSFALQPASN